MSKKVITIAATVALLVGGGAGYFTGSAVEGQASAVAVKKMQDERIIEVSKVQGQKKVEVDGLNAAAEAKRLVCVEYKGKSEEVVEGLLNALDVSTDMIVTPGDLTTTMAYSTVADGISSLISVKDEMETLAVECAGEDSTAS